MQVGGLGYNDIHQSFYSLRTMEYLRDISLSVCRDSCESALTGAEPTLASATPLAQ